MSNSLESLTTQQAFSKPILVKFDIKRYPPSIIYLFPYCVSEDMHLYSLIFDLSTNNFCSIDRIVIATDSSPITSELYLNKSSILHVSRYSHSYSILAYGILC